MLYTVLLKEWKVNNVIDLSPGSGTLARACMAQGWPYLGVCKNLAHSSWLQNVLDELNELDIALDPCAEPVEP